MFLYVDFNVMGTSNYILHICLYVYINMYNVYIYKHISVIMIQNNQHIWCPGEIPILAALVPMLANHILLCVAILAWLQVILTWDPAGWNVPTVSMSKPLLQWFSMTHWTCWWLAYEPAGSQMKLRTPETPSTSWWHRPILSWSGCAIAWDQPQLRHSSSPRSWRWTQPNSVGAWHRPGPCAHLRNQSLPGGSSLPSTSHARRLPSFTGWSRQYCQPTGNLQKKQLWNITMFTGMNHLYMAHSFNLHS